MGEEDRPFGDDALRAALRRSLGSEPASPRLKGKVAAQLLAATPGAPVGGAASRRLPSAPRPGDRVFGLPRVWGIAAAVAMLVTGGSLITYQLASQFRRPSPARIDLAEQSMAALLKVHGNAPSESKASTDIAEFQRGLPSAMPLASLPASDATFVGARLDQLEGQLCYAVQYLINGKPFTLVTAAVQPGYTVPSYAKVQGSVRLVGGDRDGWLVCLMGDASVPEKTYRTLLDDVKLLRSPSTQPVTSAMDVCR